MFRFSLIALLLATLATAEFAVTGGSTAMAQDPSPPPQMPLPQSPAQNPSAPPLLPLPQTPAPPTTTRDCHQPPVTS